MSSPQPNGDIHNDSMETTPAPEAPGAFPMTNGTSGGEDEEEGPAPPLHRTPTNPTPQPEEPQIDPEACKATGNKFYKAGQYEKAIEEYTKGLSARMCIGATTPS